MNCLNSWVLACVCVFVFMCMYAYTQPQMLVLLMGAYPLKKFLVIPDVYLTHHLAKEGLLIHMVDLHFGDTIPTQWCSLGLTLCVAAEQGGSDWSHGTEVEDLCYIT